jgi:hypothetical protein
MKMKVVSALRCSGVVEEVSMNHHGILRQTFVAKRPQQNGVAERKNWSIMEMARCMVKGHYLSDWFWVEVVQTIVFLLNCSPTNVVCGKTSYEAWSRRKLEVTNFKVFGCLACAHVAVTNRHKLEAKSSKCIFIGYSIELNAIERLL